jgi:hypothetical protein
MPHATRRRADLTRIPIAVEARAKELRAPFQSHAFPAPRAARNGAPGRAVVPMRAARILLAAYGMTSARSARGRDFDHLVRMAALFVAAAGFFAAARAALIPDGFGDLGHYRASAVEDNRKDPLVHAGREACRVCHAKPAHTLAGGAHARVGCEACHGPLARHAEAPAAHAAVRPDGRSRCVRCHERNETRPAAFPQVDPAEHAPEGACIDCHAAHAPKL